MTQQHFEDTLGCGPAPEGPVPPCGEPAGKERPAPKAPRPEPRQRVRRVGTFTMGAALIVTGLSICVSLLVPAFDITLVAKLAPLVLVALGAEVLFWSAHQGGIKLKYDFLSMLVCFVLLCASIGAAAVPVLWRYYGPDRQMTESRLANELVDAAYPALKGQNLRNMSVNVSLTGVEFDTDMTLSQLTAQDYVGVNVTLRSPFEDTDGFAAACRGVLDVLEGLNVPIRYVDFYADSETDHYSLSISGRYDWDASARQLAEMAYHEVYTENDGWIEEHNYLLREAYEEGFYLAGESGPEAPASQWSDDAMLQRAFEMGWNEGRSMLLGEGSYERTADEEAAPQAAETADGEQPALPDAAPQPEEEP